MPDNTEAMPAPYGSSEMGAPAILPGLSAGLLGELHRSVGCSIPFRRSVYRNIGSRIRFDSGSFID